MTDGRCLRVGLLALTLAGASACAHVPGPWNGPDRSMALVSSSAEPVCMIRVESAYQIPIDAGVRAGSREISLAGLNPEDVVEVGVPCSYAAATVFRVVHHGEPEVDLRLRARTQALDAERTTLFTLRPPVSGR